MTCCPHDLVSPAATKRASTSGVDPGAASEIIVTGFCGYLSAWACAAETASDPSTHNTPTPIQYRLAIISFSRLMAARIKRPSDRFHQPPPAAPNRHALIFFMISSTHGAPP